MYTYAVRIMHSPAGKCMARSKLFTYRRCTCRKPSKCTFGDRQRGISAHAQGQDETSTLEGVVVSKLAAERCVYEEIGWGMNPGSLVRR